MSAGYEAGWHDRDGEIIRWQAKRRRAVERALYYKKLARELKAVIRHTDSQCGGMHLAIIYGNGETENTTLRVLCGFDKALRDQGESR
jgi:hypothetical protein